MGTHVCVGITLTAKSIINGVLISLKKIGTDTLCGSKIKK
jgi:hypothetical protein